MHAGFFFVKSSTPISMFLTPLGFGYLTCFQYHLNRNPKPWQFKKLVIILQVSLFTNSYYITSEVQETNHNNSFNFCFFIISQTNNLYCKVSCVLSKDTKTASCLLCIWLQWPFKDQLYIHLRNIFMLVLMNSPLIFEPKSDFIMFGVAFSIALHFMPCP